MSSRKASETRVGEDGEKKTVDERVEPQKHSQENAGSVGVSTPASGPEPKPAFSFTISAQGLEAVAKKSARQTQKQAQNGSESASTETSPENAAQWPGKPAAPVPAPAAHTARRGPKAVSEKQSAHTHKSPYSSASGPRKKAGGKERADPLAEWDPTHFRLFVGNLGQDVTTKMLEEAFAEYPTMSKARVVDMKRTGKSKGYGFVAFASSDDYFKAFQSKNGKYIGSQPVQLKKADTPVRQAR